MTTANSEWLDRTFPYWKPELMPSPRQAMADMKGNDTRNFNKIIESYGVENPDRHDVGWALETLMLESGDLELQQKYGWLGSGWNVSNEGKFATHTSLKH